jgi:hypothetical protein
MLGRQMTVAFRMGDCLTDWQAVSPEAKGLDLFVAAASAAGA